MLAIDIQQDGHFWMERHQGAVAFIGFRDEKASRKVVAGVMFQLGHQRANGKAGLFIQPVQHIGKQGGGGGFAVHARDANAAFAPHEFRQQKGAPADRDARFPGRLQFGVVFGHRGGISHERGLAQVLGRVACVNARAPRAQLPGLFVISQVGPGYRMAEVEEQMPQRAHATSARAQQINRGRWIGGKDRAYGGGGIHSILA